MNPIFSTPEADSLSKKQTSSKKHIPFLDPSTLYTPTQGIKYSGSKLKLLPYILSVTRTLPVQKIFDGFSGTTRVSQAFAKNNYHVIANDRAIWSKVFGECYLKGTITKNLLDKIDHLNHLKGTSEWFTQHYGGRAGDGLSLNSKGQKKIWQIHNTQKLDAIRPEIDKIAENSIEKSILLTSLMLALDKVDNTLGHFASYLREWSPRSFHKMKLQVPLIETIPSRHKVIRQDIFKALTRVQADLSYFDPPYGSNNEKMPPSRVRYASYYHIWKTICLNDQPVLVGKANRRKDCDDKNSSSIFEEFRKDTNQKFMALKAIEKLLKKSSSPYILLSYSNRGRATKKEICQIVEEQSKKIHVFSINHKLNVMSKMRWTYHWTQKKEKKHIEFLFLIQR